MIEIPLEGFLLTPVQKICKYPLQLRELLKYTGPEHPDYQSLQEALEAMKHIASLINERKRKMESLEKLADWQDTIDDWQVGSEQIEPYFLSRTLKMFLALTVSFFVRRQGEDLIERSSDLITSGELTKVNSSGWHQDRVFFVFDHQLIYCKKVSGLGRERRGEGERRERERVTDREGEWEGWEREREGERLQEIEK